MVILKNKKQTDKELAHIDVYHKELFIGYIIKNNSALFARVNENWNFVSKHESVPMMFDKTKKALIDKINKHLA